MNTFLVNVRGESLLNNPSISPPFANTSALGLPSLATVESTAIHSGPVGVSYTTATTTVGPEVVASTSMRPGSISGGLLTTGPTSTSAVNSAPLADLTLTNNGATTNEAACVMIGCLGVVSVIVLWATILS
jgi:hypothetical protein